MKAEKWVAKSAELSVGTMVDWRAEKMAGHLVDKTVGTMVESMVVLRVVK